MAESQPHGPAMVWCHKVEEKSTKKIRVPGIEQGSRIYTVSKKPFPITMLSGDEFLSAWWQAVLCHYALWKNDVHHRDVSPNNLMVYKLNGKWIGVLNDYDLSSTLHEGPTGNERTGTVPFMALDLLEKDAIDGNVSHLYRHDAESFIWVLVWICLRYSGGKLLHLREGRLLDDWLKVDVIRCRQIKSDFQRQFRSEKLDPKVEPSLSHKSTSWKLARKCLHTLYHSPPDTDEKTTFEEWLQANMESVAPNLLPGSVDVL
ncbi:hypothetical protein DEU56DRAFT_259973 [Suillus clintonianus]|uniref:uncharacterized protein n=1 Tax=Suillus clintonianus TaxID=1904413 RepID=UPI001B864467|nr:uncharacterized protein DEU56DRAFT_259973 [Suillus clintonianus]KAG2142356.1 hypothetical protein DEU56DRAFT_259973 [Suillus clintonianus]